MELPTSVLRALTSLAHTHARATRPAIEPEDLLQEALIRIWRDGVTEPAIAIVCGKRAIVDAVRRHAGRPGSTKNVGASRTYSYDDHDGQVDPFDQYPASPSAEDEALGAMNADRIVDLVDALPDRHRDVIISRANGESLASIGARHGVTESAVSIMHSRVCHRLAPRLGRR